MEINNNDFVNGTNSQNGLITEGLNDKVEKKLFDLACNGDVQQFKELYEEYKNKYNCSINYKSKLERNKKTLLIEAAYWGSLSVVEYLIEQGANLNIQDNENKTALHWSVTQSLNLVITIKRFYYANEHNMKHIEVIKILLANGIDVKIKDNKEETALNIAKKKKWQ